MKITFYLLAILCCFLAACNSPQNAPSEEKITVTLSPTDFKTLDTLRFESDTNAFVVNGRNPFTVLRIDGKDTVKGVTVGIFYFEKGQQIFAFKDTIIVGDEVESYQSYLGFPGYEGPESKPCEQFFDLNYGYPACGYDQTHLLFYRKKGHCSFVTKHVSSGDGPYGYGLNFQNLCTTAEKPIITSTILVSAPDEKNDVIIVNQVSDSVKYEFDGKSWKITPVTPKDKVFRENKERFDEEGM